MFSNFTGAHRRPRVVNLGGSVRRSTPGDKQSLLDKTAKERAKREQLRKEEKAATTIQSFYRAKRDLSFQRTEARNNWCNYLCQLWNISSDKDLEQLANSHLDTGSLEFRHLGHWPPSMAQCAGEESLAKIPADRLVHLIRQFSFFYKGDDLFSFLLFCHLLVTIAKSRHLLHLDGVYQSKRFPGSLMKILNESKNLNTNSFAFFAAINAVDALITYIPSEPLFIDISMILTRARTSGSHLSLAALAGLTSLICEKVISDPDNAYINFAAYLASTPFLFEILPPSQLTAIRTHVSLATVLLKTRQIAESGQLMKKLRNICATQHDDSGTLSALERCTWLLTQLVSWYRNTSPIPSKAESIIFSFVKTISQLLSTIFTYSTEAYREKQSSNILEEEAELLDGVITSNKSIFSVLPVAHEPFIVDNLDFLANREFVEVVLSLADDVNPRNLSLYFVNMVHCWPSRRDDILLYLSIQQKSVLSIFYHALVEANFFQDATDHKFTMSDFNDADQGSWTIVVMLLELYSYWLIVFDDEEFFGMGGTGFSLSEVERLAKFLKEVAFLLVWNDNAYNDNDKLNGNDITYGRLKSLTVRVLTQIYIRDSRRRFLPKGFWLMTDKYDMSSFISSVVEEEQRIRSNRDNQGSSEVANHDSHTETRHRILRKANASKLRHELAISPRLRILHSLPFFIPFNVRVSVFQEFIVLDRKQVLNDPFTVFFSGMAGTHKADIRRDHLLEDAYGAFNNLGPEFKKPIQVQFFNQYGPEAGIDGGGITKEFLTSICEYTLRPETGLFVSTPDHRFYPNPTAIDSDSLSLIEFFGRIIGKCLYEKILVEVQFAPFFLSKLQGRSMKNGIDDLYTYDPSLYNGLIQLKKYPGNVEEDLGLNFTVTEDVTLTNNNHNNNKPPKTVELVPGGANTPVNNTNRLEYIYAFANYKLNTQISRQTNAFINGLADLISPSWLTMFNSEELQTLISGGEQTIDVEDWRKHTVYGGFWETDQTVQDFWQIVSEFSNEDRRKLLKFVTSVSRAPLLGFTMLQPLFSLRNAGPDKTRLPTTSTCVNLLKLPDYKDKALLKQKLLYAINAEAGFDLS